jgi:putative YphP/YqiW family bacilliredoxin
VAILSNRKVLFMLQRHEIEGRTPDQIAAALTDAYRKLASPAA